MLFAIGSLELMLATGLGAVVIAAPITLILVQRKRFKFIPLVAIPALLIVLAAASLSWWGAFGAMDVLPLTSDVVILIDTSHSMAASDDYHDADAKEHADKLAREIRQQLERDLPDKIQAASADPELLAYWREQSRQLAANTWKASRLQLGQALLTKSESGWLNTLVQRHRARVHVYHLDANGRAVKLRDANGETGAIDDPGQPGQIVRVTNAIMNLAPIAKQSPLGAVLRQLIHEKLVGPLTSVVLLTDGLTTTDESIAQAARHAESSGVAVFFVGLGDEPRRLVLDDLRGDDVTLGERTVFDVRLTGVGYYNVAVPVLLKRKGDDKEIQRQLVKLDALGRSPMIRLSVLPDEAGVVDYVIEAVPPNVEANGNAKPPAPVRLEHRVVVGAGQPIKVLFVEGQPRSEFHFLKASIERSAAIDKNPAIELKVLLLDADPDWADHDTEPAPGEKPLRIPQRKQTKTTTAISRFPDTLNELNKYDVLILGDCDPNHVLLRNHLKNIVRFVRGEDENDKSARRGGGLLFLAGPSCNPHIFRNTPLAELLPVEPLGEAPVDQRIASPFRPKLTPDGDAHPIFRFDRDDGKNRKIWQAQTPIFWQSTGYRIKPNAVALAVHPSDKAAGKPNDEDARHPLIVERPAGTGNCLFVGIDETWRWRLRGEDQRVLDYWTRTFRYLSPSTMKKTELRLDRNVPYRAGEPIRISVTFADLWLPALERERPQISVTFLPSDRKDPQFQSFTLDKTEGKRGHYHATMAKTEPGKYRIRLTEPDVRMRPRDDSTPTVTANVERPIGERDAIGMNGDEMRRAGAATNGAYVSIGNADRLLDLLPSARR